MPEHQIKHKLVAQDFSGTGTPTQEQGLDSSEWNENHGTLVPGLGIEITSDGGSPPRYTFALTATSVASDLIPSIDDMFVVGTQSKRWRSGYFSRAVSVGATFAILPNDLKLTSGDLTITAPTLRLSSAGVQFLSISRLSSLDSQVPVFTSNSFMRFRVSDNVGMGVYQFNNDDDTNSLIIDAGFTEITPSVSGVWDLGFTNAFRIGKFTNELRLGASSEWQIDSTTTNVLKFNLSFTEKARFDTSKFSTVSGVTVSAGGGFQTNATSTLAIINPTSDNINDLGAVSARWRSIFYSGTASGGTSVVSSITVSTTTSAGSLVLTTPQGVSGAIKFSNGTGFSVDSTGQLQLDGSPDLRPGVDESSELGSDTKRFKLINTPVWRNTGAAAPTGLTMQMSQYALTFEDSLPGAIRLGQDIHTNLLDFGTSSRTFRNAYFGGTISAGGAYFGGTVSAGSDSVYNLGTPTLRWRAVYTTTISSGSSNLRLTADGGSSDIIFTTGNGFVYPNANGAYVFGKAANRWAQVFTLDVASGSSDLILTPATAVTPNADNSKDFGTTALRWRSGYFGTTISGGNIFASAGTFNGQLRVKNDITIAALGILTFLTVDNIQSAVILHSKTNQELSLGVADGSGSTASFIPETDASDGQIGTSTFRWNTIHLKTAGVAIRAAAGDSQAQANFTGTGARWGPGGASALDAKLERSAANTLLATASSGFLTSGLTSAGGGWQTNASPIGSIGGAGVITTTSVGGQIDKVSITVNGVTRYIALYDS